MPPPDAQLIFVALMIQKISAIKSLKQRTVLLTVVTDSVHFRTPHKELADMLGIGQPAFNRLLSRGAAALGNEIRSDYALRAWLSEQGFTDETISHLLREILRRRE